MYDIYVQLAFQNSRQKAECQSNDYSNELFFVSYSLKNEKQPDSGFVTNEETGVGIREIPFHIDIFALSGVSGESHTFERIAKTCVLSNGGKNAATSFDIRAGAVMFC